MKRLGRWLNWTLLALLGIFVAWQLWLLGWVLLWKWVDPGTTRLHGDPPARTARKEPGRCN